MALNWLDWSIVVVFMGLALGIGLATSRRAGRGSAEFFLSGREMLVAAGHLDGRPTSRRHSNRHGRRPPARRRGNWVWWVCRPGDDCLIYAALAAERVMTDIESAPANASRRF